MGLSHFHLGTADKQVLYIYFLGVLVEMHVPQAQHVLKNNYLKIIVLQKMERDPQIIRGYKWHVNKNWKVKKQFGGPHIFI